MLEKTCDFFIDVGIKIGDSFIEVGRVICLGILNILAYLILLLYLLWALGRVIWRKSAKLEKSPFILACELLLAAFIVLLTEDESLREGAF